MSRQRGVAVKEIGEVLGHKNAVRAFFVALALIFIIPVDFFDAGALIWVIPGGGLRGGGAGAGAAQGAAVTAWLIVAEVIEMGMACAGYFIFSKGYRSYYNLYYMTQYYSVTAFGLIISGFYLNVTGSTIGYIISAAGVILIPVLDGLYFKLFMGYYSEAAMVSVIMAHRAGGAGGGGRRAGGGVAEVVCLCVMSWAAAAVIERCVCGREQTRIRLRAKSISADMDPLTALANRRGLDRKAAVLWPYCARTQTNVGLIEIDIDFFKKYNDRFGHPAGDKCLKEVAHAIKNTAKRYVDITARTGGEEFIIFVQNMTEAELVEFAMKVRKSVADLKIAHAYAGVSEYVTVSMGIAYGVPGEDYAFDDMYEEADRALYKAKNSGRNCIVCGNRVYGRMRGGVGAVI